MNLRQIRRRHLFQQFFEQMPRFETWTTAHVNSKGESKDRQHVKVIPRRVRRDMARIRSKRKAVAQGG